MASNIKAVLFARNFRFLIIPISVSTRYSEEAVNWTTLATLMMLWGRRLLRPGSIRRGFGFTTTCGGEWNLTGQILKTQEDTLCRSILRLCVGKRGRGALPHGAEFVNPSTFKIQKYLNMVKTSQPFQDLKKRSYKGGCMSSKNALALGIVKTESTELIYDKRQRKTWKL